MLAIMATNLGRRFNDTWIFRNLNFSIPAGGSLAILGHNGSGKSTLVKILAGHLDASEGQLQCVYSGNAVEADQLYRHISWCAPYIESYGQLSVQELFQVHFRFKQCLLADVLTCLAATRLAEHKQKRIRELSSGQVQRAYLGLALFSASSLLLLDEPTSHMDADNAAYALQLVAQYQGDRTLVMASNQPREYEAVSNRLRLA
jgi:ABC-type multidrug transport system ATPase subunit